MPLIEDHTKPYRVYVCPACIAPFVGAGLDMQTCPDCRGDKLRAVPAHQHTRFIDSHTRWCPICLRLLAPPYNKDDCRIHGFSHTLLKPPQSVL
jgi:hypothetical protein